MLSVHVYSLFIVCVCLAKQNGFKRLEIADKLIDNTLFDDDYIAMDPVYTEPPLEEDWELDIIEGEFIMMYILNIIKHAMVCSQTL